MRTVFRYPGGKSKARARQWIMGHRPDHYADYREPFVGGGGIFWDQPPHLRRWVNDMNAGLMAVYSALRDRPAEFIDKCRAIAPEQPGDPLTAAGPKGGLPVNARLKAVFDRLARGDADEAFRYFFLNRTTFGGRVNYDLPSRQRLTNPEGWNIVEGDRLERAAETMRGVKVTCGDFAQLLLQPGEDVWVYCDPPYLVNDDLPPTSKLYQHGFTWYDHERLAEAVLDSPHKVSVSYGADPDGRIRRLYPRMDGFHIVEKEWVYCGTTGKRERGRELLVLNYQAATARAAA